MQKPSHIASPLPESMRIQVIETTNPLKKSEKYSISPRQGLEFTKFLLYVHMKLQLLAI